MTVVVDTYNLKSKHLTDDIVLIASDWVEWESGAIAKKRKVYGAKGQWTFSLFESGVAWASSAAKYLQDKAKSGGMVSLTVDEGDRFSLAATTCYVLSCQTSFPLTGTVNMRYFTVTFREV